VIFLGEFSHCGYKENLKKLGKFFLIVWIWEKDAQKMENFDKVYKHKTEKKKGEKKNTDNICIWYTRCKY
jgi:hypothetical protein